MRIGDGTFIGCTGVGYEKESVGSCSLSGLEDGCKDSCKHHDKVIL